MNDEKLIKLILRRGSKEAADTLIRKYYDEIFRFAFKQMNNKDDALDLTQEIFMATLKSLYNFDSKKAGFRTWLYRIATNKTIDIRRTSKPITVPLDEFEISQDDFIEKVLQKDLLERIEKYVATFPSDIQIVFRLRIYGEFSFPEIAEQTGESEEKIKAQYYRLSKKLKKEFCSYEE